MQSSEESYYSNDEEYFLDLCRGGDMQELKQFVQGLGEPNNFDWTCLTNSHDNFLHMLGANNLVEVFEYLYPIVTKKIGSEGWQVMLNKQNSTGNTPLHYAVITNSKDMVLKLVKAGADTNITNGSGRTAFTEAEEFDKIEIAEILAPLTNNNLEQLKKEVEILDICHQDSDDDEQQPQHKQQPKIETKQPTESKEQRKNE